MEDMATVERAALQIASASQTKIGTVLVHIQNDRSLDQRLEVAVTTGTLGGLLEEMIGHGKSRTQISAERLMNDRYDAMLVRSFAPGTKETDLNIVLWFWGTTEASLSVIDDEGRRT